MENLLPKRHTLTGFVNQSELGRYYSCADVLVLPSSRYHETWGLVVNEAMTFELPVIVSDGVGCREDLVKNRQTGFIFTADDREDLTQCILKLGTNTELLREYSANTRNIIKHHTVDETARTITRTITRDISSGAQNRARR